MGRGREAGYASDRDEFEGAREGASRNAKQHKQFGIDVPELRTIGRGREARYISNEDKDEGAREEASRHAN